MSRTDARGATFEDALATAIADLLDCDADEVEVRLDAPGLETLTGPVRFELSIDGGATGDDEPQPADADGDRAEERDADEPDGARGEQDEDRGEAADDRADRDEDGGDADEDRDDEREDRGDERGGRGERPREELTAEDLDDEADAAADFLEGLLDALDLPGDLRIKVHEDHAEVEVLDIGSGALIGRRGQTLEAIQELVRCALQREFQRRSRVKVDAEGYRARRLEKLLEKAEEAIDEVLDTGDPQRLEPMDVFERKAVHRLVAEYDGVSSRSQGREPARRVIIEAD